MSELDIAERRVPQDGRFRVRYKGRLIDFRVSIMPTVHGENAVLRVLDKESMSEKFRNLTLDVVGFAEDDLRRFRRYIREPYGMVLVTGPTGSGKTTTLYAALNEIKSDEDKIITIEDPVEYQIRGITQIPGQREEGPDLRPRPALHPAPRSRQDPGRRNPRPGDRPDRHQLRAHRPPGLHHRPRQQRGRRARPLPQHGRRGLQLRLRAQLHPGAAPGPHHLRALRRAPSATPTKSLIASGLDPAEWRGFDFREGAGCIECGGTGYRGRTAIHELLDLTDPIRELILEKKPTSEIRKLAQTRRHELPARIGPRPRSPRPDHAQRNQQSHLHRGIAMKALAAELVILSSSEGPAS